MICSRYQMLPEYWNWMAHFESNWPFQFTIHLFSKQRLQSTILSEKKWTEERTQAKVIEPRPDSNPQSYDDNTTTPLTKKRSLKNRCEEENLREFKWDIYWLRKSYINIFTLVIWCLKAYQGKYWTSVSVLLQIQRLDDAVIFLLYLQTLTIQW